MVFNSWFNPASTFVAMKSHWGELVQKFLKAGKLPFTMESSKLIFGVQAIPSLAVRPSTAVGEDRLVSESQLIRNHATIA